MDALLKTDGDGNLTKITHAEEDYIAYQIGLRLSLDTAGSTVAGLNTSSGTTVGTFTDTSFDDAVGIHDGSLTTTTTTVTLKQKNGTASESGGNFHKPVIFDRSATGDVVALKAANDTELNTIVDRVLLKTFANEHPGCRRLSASSPGGDWTAALSNVFTDTRTDGTSINYSIWIKTSGTVPTKVAPQILHNTFDLKSMTAAEIQYTFGQRAKTRIMAGGIGTYQLRNASEGVPTDPGTWVAKGTATDTKQTTADVNYTRTSTGNFIGNYIGNYSGTFTRDSIGNYDGIFTRNSTRSSTNDFTRNSTDDFIGNYLQDYVGNYAGNFIGDYVTVRPAEETNNPYTRQSIGSANYGSYTGSITYTGDYLGGIDEAQHFTRISTRDSTQLFSAYTGNFTGNYTGDYMGAYTGNYSRPSDVAFTGNYETNFSGNYTGDFVGNYEGAFTGNYDGEYEGQFAGDYTGNYAGNFTRDSTRDSTSDYTGNYSGETIQATSTTIDTYTLYVRTA